MQFDRQGIADHATNLATTIQLNLKRSLEAIGVVRAAATAAAAVRAPSVHPSRRRTRVAAAARETSVLAPTFGRSPTC